MINAKEAQNLMLSSDKEKVNVAIKIYSAILDSKNQCRIDFWPSVHTISLLREHGYNIIFSDNFIIVSW